MAPTPSHQAVTAAILVFLLSAGLVPILTNWALFRIRSYDWLGSVNPLCDNVE